MKRLWTLEFILWLEKKRVKVSCVYIGTGISEPQLASHPARFGTVSKLRMVFTFVKSLKRIQDQDHMWPAKPKIFTLWSFRENICRPLTW